MARTDEEVVSILRDIYNAEFSGKARQRFLISWPDIRAIYGFRRLETSRFDRLAEAGIAKRLYIIDLGEGETGHMVAVLRMRTIDRWRRATKRIIDEYRLPLGGDDDDEDEDAE